MEFKLFVRVLIDIKEKDKADAFAEKTFPELALENNGKYFQNEDQWEFNGRKVFSYDDEKVALWETLSYFSQIQPNWIILSGPNGDSFEVLVSVVSSNSGRNGLAWCSYELKRVE